MEHITFRSWAFFIPCKLSSYASNDSKSYVFCIFHVKMFCRTECSLTVSAVEALPTSFLDAYKYSSRNLNCWYMFSFLMSSQHCKVVI